MHFCQVGADDTSTVEAVQAQYDPLLADETPIDLVAAANSPLLDQIMESVKILVEELSTSELHQLWLQYIEMVDILEYNLICERTGSNILNHSSENA